MPYIEILFSSEYVSHQGVKIVPTKTKKSRRTVYIPPMLVSMLKEMYLVSHEGHVFALKDEYTCIHPDSVTRHATIMCNKYGLPHFSPHTLRRTLATTLATRSNVDPKTLQVILGHADLRTLLKFYVLPEDDVKKDAIMKYTDFFNKNGKSDERIGVGADAPFP